MSGPDEARQLASLIFNPARTKPLIVMSQVARTRLPWVDPNTVQVMAGDAAAVMVLAPNARLSDYLSRELTVFDGAVRLYRPGATTQDDIRDHPLILVRDADDAVNLLPKILRTLRFMLDDLGGAKLPRPAGSADVSASLAAELEETRAELAEANAERQRESDAHRETRAKLSTTKQALDLATKQRDAAQQALAAHTEPVFNDPAEQLRHEIYLAWLAATVDGPDRTAWALRDYTVGPEFLDSIAKQQLVDRERIVRACVDVISGRYMEIAGRRAHRVHIGGSPHTPPVTRTEDDAQGWMCAIRGKGAGAAQITWWEIGRRNAVELSLVTHMQDVRLV